jgi:hypothetical protein
VRGETGWFVDQQQTIRARRVLSFRTLLHRWVREFPFA